MTEQIKERILKCKHTWKHEVKYAKTMSGNNVLGIFHVCKKCGLSSIGEVLIT